MFKSDSLPLSSAKAALWHSVFRIWVCIDARSLKVILARCKCEREEEAKKNEKLSVPLVTMMMMMMEKWETYEMWIASFCFHFVLEDFFVWCYGLCSLKRKTWRSSGSIKFILFQGTKIITNIRECRSNFDSKKKTFFLLLLLIYIEERNPTMLELWIDQ